LPPVVLDIADDDPDDLPSRSLVILYSLYIFHKCKCIFFGQKRLSGTTLPILTLCLCENMS
jgi:hypothetical protein